ncbi:ABC transporter ATP-binding protein [Spirochaeta isovalerica]|uniref:Phospholipid/cholesterol/gamma-HCH transport system ATP-binding protein n=1 Tax=Spirochaeta isovalerica TaxID=150 RepID=A0A841R492_9SPIO|nr:ATP-binding cassette domain-containing protein [Spirochaeta isovalerica]MBB6478623.1 phospholipid/cholesterol/gamma-HCH transport system ATP-binding protein [Spirochaeta isovalerica]
MKDVTLQFEGETVLKSINLEIKPESSTVIFGRSGSGKTTLLKAMAGLIRIDDGEVLYNGDNIAKMNESDFFEMQAQSGFVFQDAALWANKTIYDNLAIPLRILRPGMNAVDIDKRIRSAVDMLAVRENLLIRPSAISSGERKIISFLRALMTDPDILFLDEPAVSLDKKSSRRIHNLIKELNEEKKTIITVTNDFSLARMIADNLIIIEGGSVIRQGCFSEILTYEDKDIEDIIEDIKGQV